MKNSESLWTISELEDILCFLRTCDWLGERAFGLARQLSPLLEEHIESLYSFDDQGYGFLLQDD